MAEEDENTNASEIGGIPDDTPDEVRNFVAANDVADKYTVMLKRKPEGGGTAQSIKNYTNYYPSVDHIGKTYGPGDYELVFSWRGEGMSGKKEPITRGFKISLPEDVWGEIYEDDLYDRRRKRTDKKTKQWEEDAAKVRAQGGMAAPAAAPSELDVIRKALETAKSLGIPVGGTVKPEKEAPKRSFMDRLAEALPAITALGAIVSPIVVAIIQKPREKADTTLTSTLLAHALNKPAENPMKDVMPFLLGSLKQIMEVKQSMEPEEKESMVERIIGKIAPLVPTVLAMATQGPAAVNANPIVQQVRKSPDFQVLAEDPEALIMTVQRFDERYGFQNTNDILSVAGLARPAELAGNQALFPSKGYRKDGLTEEQYAEAARGAKLPDGPQPGAELESHE